eukprot:CAMPEP_0113910144 /NCGR_PEP_ID=MMETSP0780_2-20120614/27326_1 /TAXON_ID=652834 /ORGANISM="Palpitomonas bilix" /LENGTH=203 /DNA_ID=CAMNT_0000906195 /DNA_START=18 /DNA_END=629 /DNA_ORIENTATION=- /assembly_acc=CAM_ASM_000599
MAAMSPLAHAKTFLFALVPPLTAVAMFEPMRRRQVEEEERVKKEAEDGQGDQQRSVSALDAAKQVLFNSKRGEGKEATPVQPVLSSPSPPAVKEESSEKRVLTSASAATNSGNNNGGEGVVSKGEEKAGKDEQQKVDLLLARMRQLEEEVKMLKAERQGRTDLPSQQGSSSLPKSQQRPIPETTASRTGKEDEKDKEGKKGAK